MAAAVVDPIVDALDALDRAELLELLSQRFEACPPDPGGDLARVELFVGLIPSGTDAVWEASVSLLSADEPGIARWSCAAAAASGATIESASEAVLPLEQWTVALGG